MRRYWLLSFKTSTFSCCYPRLAKESASFKYISFLKEKNGVKGEILIKMKEEHDGGNMKDLKPQKQRADPSSADIRGGFAVC